ncbi:hypothetical protein LEP1GSC168_3275 [Leptospira santarosai str. HAI134]|nr:hypothetical protein LEP1GSC169_1556 [Leptospira santarosai str. HAI1349]EMO24026.1 hypothetical protein LEP1GSC168_3275 [Leptospira santarosai str. HAI134]EMP81693.1 hypothetical protein LEP1GSC162_3099 [Leptospira santarosai str. CBC1531]
MEVPTLDSFEMCIKLSIRPFSGVCEIACRRIRIDRLEM